MVIYVYRCSCRDVEQNFPMGTAPTKIGTCPRCAKDIRRVYTPPAITYGPGMKPPWADKPQPDTEKRWSR